MDALNRIADALETIAGYMKVEQENKYDAAQSRIESLRSRLIECEQGISDDATRALNSMLYGKE